LEAPEVLGASIQNNSGPAFWRKFVFPEEDRRRLYPEIWSGSCRWFRSPNVVELYRYRSSAEKARICTALLLKVRQYTIDR
jgi:hypothetical protein